MERPASRTATSDPPPSHQPVEVVDGAVDGGAEGARRLGRDVTISVVIPCYDEEAVLPRLFERIQAVARGWTAAYEVILIDDGSRDATWEILRDFHRRDPRWKMLRLARNFGHQTALRAGLRAASGDLVAVLDADLQDPPEALDPFFEKWAEGYDVIYGVRRHRPEGRLRRAAYFLFYRILSMLAEDDIPLDAGDFSVMDRRIVDLLSRMPERKPFIRGLRSWVGFRQLALPYDRDTRQGGISKYRFDDLMGLAVDGILSSSILPLRFATYFGAVVSFLAFFGAMVTFLLRLFPAPFAQIGLEVKPGGTATIIISILFLGGVQLMGLGICGEYLGRVYENVKGRPFWTISETLGVEPPPAEASSSFVKARSAVNG